MTAKFTLPLGVFLRSGKIKYQTAMSFPYIFISGFQDNSIKIFNIISKKYVQKLVKHDKLVNCIAFSTENKILIAGSKDCKISVWKLSNANSLSEDSN
jgi:WD40 repeat protein